MRSAPNKIANTTIIKITSGTPSPNIYILPIFLLVWGKYTTPLLGRRQEIQKQLSPLLAELIERLDLGSGERFVVDANLVNKPAKKLRRSSNPRFGGSSYIERVVRV